MMSPRRRRYVLFLLFMVSVFNYVDRTILSVLQVPIKADLGLSDAQLGGLTGLAFALFYTTLSLPIRTTNPPRSLGSVRMSSSTFLPTFFDKVVASSWISSGLRLYALRTSATATPS